MRKIVFSILGLILLTTNSNIYALAEEPTLETCMSAWSACFDKADLELTETLEQLSKSNKSTSELTALLPNIVRTHRRQLFWICRAAEMTNTIKNEDENEKNETNNEAKLLTVLEAGNEKITIPELEERFGSLENCKFNTDTTYDIQRLWDTCQIHAQYKVDLLESVLPVITRKSSNRKQMGFLSFKLTDLSMRLEKFMSYTLNGFGAKFNKIVESLKCVSKTCE